MDRPLFTFGTKFEFANGGSQHVADFAAHAPYASAPLLCSSSFLASLIFAFRVSFLF